MTASLKCLQPESLLLFFHQATQHAGWQLSGQPAVQHGWPQQPTNNQVLWCPTDRWDNRDGRSKPVANIRAEDQGGIGVPNTVYIIPETVLARIGGLNASIGAPSQFVDHHRVDKLAKRLRLHTSATCTRVEDCTGE